MEGGGRVVERAAAALLLGPAKRARAFLGQIPSPA